MQLVFLQLNWRLHSLRKRSQHQLLVFQLVEVISDERAEFVVVLVHSWQNCFSDDAPTFKRYSLNLFEVGDLGIVLKANWSGIEHGNLLGLYPFVQELSAFDHRRVHVLHVLVLVQLASVPFLEKCQLVDNDVILHNWFGASLFSETQEVSELGDVFIGELAALDFFLKLIDDAFPERLDLPDDRCTVISKRLWWIVSVDVEIYHIFKTIK